MNNNGNLRDRNIRINHYGGGRHFRQLCGLLLTFAMLMSLITVAVAAPVGDEPVVFTAVYEGDADIAGLGEPGETINVYEAGNATPIATATVDAMGFWYATLPAVATTANTFEITQTVSGVESTPVSVAVVEDAGDIRYIILPHTGGLAIPGVYPVQTTYATTTTALPVPVTPGEDYELRVRDANSVSYDATTVFSAITPPSAANLVIYTLDYVTASNPYHKATIEYIDGVRTEVNLWEEFETVAIDAGLFAGYDFVRWDTSATSPNSWTITSPNDISTSFVMPGHDVTVKAIWQLPSSIPGAGSGGGSTSGGSTPPDPSGPPTDPSGTGEPPVDDDDDGDGVGTGARPPSDHQLPRFEMGLLDDFIPLGVFNPNHIAYLNGYTEGDVQPDTHIMRSEASALIFRILSDPNRFEHLDNSFEFADWEWYYEPVTYLTSIGIIQGYDDGSFRADSRITRAEFMTMISRFGITEGPIKSELSDISGHWGEEYIIIGVSNGYISGYPDGTFRPDNPITRAEVVSVLNRLLYRGIEIEDIPGWAPSFWDLDESHWAYADIMEAATGHEFERKDNGYEIWTDALS